MKGGLCDKNVFTAVGACLRFGVLVNARVFLYWRTKNMEVKLMKQSKKLLSLVLALVMAFSFVGVIGNAGLVKDAIYYDSVDDAILSPEQVADLALDLVDDLLADANISFSLNLLITSINLDLTSLDKAYETLLSTYNSTLWSIASGMLGDVGDLNLSDLGNGSTPYQRASSGDMKMAYQLLALLNTNKSVVAGLIGNGISLGTLGSFIDLNLGSINDILKNPASLVNELVFDLLIHGSYNTSYEDDSFPDAEYFDGALPSGVDTVDGMLKYAIGSILKNPQNYSWDKDSEGNDVKTWDTSSVILPTIANNADWSTDVVAGYFDPYSQSFFTILDKLVPFAIKDLGVNALNHNLKKALMEAVEADINEIDVTELPGYNATKGSETLVAADFEIHAEDGKESYCNYIAYDRLCKDGKTWYYTTIETETVMENGEPVIDDETGEEKTERVRKYFKVNMAAANEFADVINWDWNIKAEQNCLDATSGRTIPALSTVAIDTIDYYAIIGQYGSIVESLNHIIYIVFENALTTDIKNEFKAITGAGWVDGATSTCIMDNLTRTVKFLLSKFGDKMFGSDSEFADMPYASEYDEETGAITDLGLEDMSLVEIIAKIGPSFFGDAMPQLIMPRYQEDTEDANGNPHKAGDYAFQVNSNGENVQLFQFGALVLREFMTEIAPGVNYDSYIFAAGSVTSADDRQFADRSVDEWFNLILNMGMDIAYTYLYNLTNFGDTVDYNITATDNTYGLLGESSWRTSMTVPAAGDTEARWQDMLDTVIMWAVNYVGQGDLGILNGITPNAVNGISGPLNKLSFILNTLLPLNFINNCSSSTYAFDVATLVDKAKVLFTDLDLTQLSSLFGRPSGSLLSTNNFIQQVLNLANNILNLVIGATVLQDTTCVDNALTNANLQTTVTNLLGGLNTRKEHILISALPVLAKLIKSWGGEQELESPEINIPQNLELTTGARTDSFTVSNGSTGVWRGYRSTAIVDPSAGHAKDEQYSYTVKNLTVKTYSVSAVSETGVPTAWTEDATSKVTINNNSAITATKINYGETMDIPYSVSGVNTYGSIAVFELTYMPHDEDGANLVAEDVTDTIYSWLSYDPGNGGRENRISGGSDNSDVVVYSPHYVDINSGASTIPNIQTGMVARSDGGLATKDQDAKMIASTQTVHGITWGNVDIAINKYCHSGNSDSYATSVGSGFAGIYGFQTNTYQGIWATRNNTGSWISPNYVAADFLTVSGSFNAATWQSYVDNGTLYPGAKSSWSLSVTEHNDSGTIGFEIRYYDGDYLSDLQGLVSDEISKNVNSDTYHITGTKYADSVLVATDDAATADENEKVTNFTDKATVDGIEVTAINCATAWTTYQKALKDAIRGAWQPWNDNSVYNHEELYHNLRIAAADMEICKKLGTEVTAETNDDLVLALEAQLDSIEATWSDTKDYTDYLMHRWNRYNDTREDARNIVNAYEATLLEDIDLIKYFPYTGVYPSEVDAMVAGDEYADFITALFDDFDEETIEAKRAEFENAQARYRSITALDIAQASNLLDRIPGRLITRPTAVYDQFLEDEIASARAMIDNDNKDENGQQIYTTRSWAKYSAALETAEKVLLGTDAENPKTQMTVFDTKYELLTARNELVKVADEADYSELLALISQAEYALANSDLYDNTNEDFGKVLAELGYKTFTNSNGNNVELFPMNAKYVNTEPYSKEDQDVIDDASTALKEALSKLKFKGVTVPGTTTEVIVEGNKEEGIEEVTASVATIAALQKADAVKGLFNELDGATITAKIVTEDINYSVGCDYVKEIEDFVGTNATITFYSKTSEGIEIPVATVKLVVEADVNGDGVIDALDATIAQLASTEHKELTGCYYLAANLDTAAEAINGADYQAIVTEVLAA